MSIPGNRGGRFWADVSVSPLVSPSGKLEGYVSVQRDVTVEVEREEQLAIAARTDELTGLGNRQFLHSRLARALELRQRRNDYNFAVIFLDIDRFKLINDSLGHQLGDKVLQEVAARLRSVLRSSDAVMVKSSAKEAIRCGGDEFVVFLDNFERAQDVVNVAERVLLAMSEPYQFSGYAIQSSASVGIVFGSQQYSDPNQVLRDADTALFEAKNRGKACWVIFDDSMQKAVERRLNLENALQSQHDFDQFFLLYQPIVAASTGRLCGVEALIRWKHPKLGLISPMEFIPIAEECHLIVKLGRWIIEEACQQWSQWQTDHADLAPDYVSINLSRIQLADPDFVSNVEEILRRTGITPERVVFEITESTVMTNPQAIRETLVEVKKLGVRLAIDDFGTGHSSLSCLHEFPLDILKIDRSFVMSFNKSYQIVALTQAIVSLAKHLGMVCIAEGAEEASEVETLKTIECSLIQGYYFGKPMTAADILAKQRESAGKNEPLRDSLPPGLEMLNPLESIPSQTQY